MRAQTNELQRFVVRFAVNEYEIGAQMAVSMVSPLPGQRMIAAARRQRVIGRQGRRDLLELPIEHARETAPLLAPVVALEGRGSFNRPH